jgi:phosphoribosyl-ATP pyrophosphohydrolase
MIKTATLPRRRKIPPTGSSPTTSLAADRNIRHDAAETLRPVRRARDASSLPATAEGACELDRLYAAIGLVTTATNPRTAKLLESSTRKIAQKVIEEAGEVALEAVKRRPRGVVRESADLIYHLVALWHRAGIEPADVWQEMRERAETLGIAEKLPKSVRSVTA